MADPLGGSAGVTRLGPITSSSRPIDSLAPVQDMMARMALGGGSSEAVVRRDPVIHLGIATAAHPQPMPHQLAAGDNEALFAAPNTGDYSGGPPGDLTLGLHPTIWQPLGFDPTQMRPFRSIGDVATLIACCERMRQLYAQLGQRETDEKSREEILRQLKAAYEFCGFDFTEACQQSAGSRIGERLVRCGVCRELQMMVKSAHSRYKAAKTAGTGIADSRDMLVWTIKRLANMGCASPPIVDLGVALAQYFGNNNGTPQFNAGLFDDVLETLVDGVVRFDCHEAPGLSPSNRI